jgi:hypothetical protein
MTFDFVNMNNMAGSVETQSRVSGAPQMALAWPFEMFQPGAFFSYFAVS